MVVRLSEGSASVDCDLYVRRNAKPTNVVFDYSDVSLGGANSTISLETPDGSYWIGVYAFQNCSYTLVVEEGSSTDCLRGCSGHGTCDDGVCTCTPPWTGDDCSTQMGSLQSGVRVSGAVSINQWAYYNFTASQPLVTFQMFETGSNGSLWLFVSTESNPTLAAHDYQDIDFDRPFHAIHIERDSATPETYFVGVYGDPM